MLTAYINAAMHRAKYSILEDDGTFVGTIPDCQGVWASADTLEACRGELQEVYTTVLRLCLSDVY